MEKPDFLRIPKNIRESLFFKVGGVRILAEDCAKEIGGMGQGGGWRGRLKEDKPSEDFIREFSVMISNTMIMTVS